MKFLITVFIFSLVISCEKKESSQTIITKKLPAIPIDSYLTSYRDSFQYFQSCGEIQQDIRTRILAWQDYHKQLREQQAESPREEGGVWRDSAPRSTSQRSSSSQGDDKTADESADSFENNQVEGVSESDIYKFNGRFSLIYSNSKIHISQINPLQYLGAIEQISPIEPKIYLTQTHMVVILVLSLLHRYAGSRRSNSC